MAIRYVRLDGGEGLVGTAMITIKLKALLSMVPLHAAAFFDNDLL